MIILPLKIQIMYVKSSQHDHYYFYRCSLGVRTITGTNTFMVYEIWANSEDLNR